MDWRNGIFFDFDLTDEQKDYLESIFTNRLTIVDAKAGTGKTSLAVAAAKVLRMNLLYVFNPVEEDKMGFRPGTQSVKEMEYAQPLKDALVKIREKPDMAIYNPELGDSFLNKGSWVEVKSHIFARGTNHFKKFIIIDEAQNWTVGQLKKMLTRIHDDCKVVVIGHMGQIDLANPADSGFETLKEHFASKRYAGTLTLTKNFRGQLANDADEMVG